MRAKDIIKKVRAKLKPPPKLSISQWANRFRILSPESSAEHGRFYIQRTPYNRKIVDSVKNPWVLETWFRKSSQIGYSENLNNCIGYFIHLDPCPMMMLQPTLDMAQAYSKDRINPMIRDTPELSALVDDRSRQSGNTILHKKFPGGHLTMCGANSPASLASRPIRGIIVDEPDRYPPSAGEEGDPINILKKRATTFFNRFFFGGGTPTVKGRSRIDQGFERGNQQFYNVPCPHCKRLQSLEFDNFFMPFKSGDGVKKLKDIDEYTSFESLDVAKTAYRCEYCEETIEHSSKLEMLVEDIEDDSEHGRPGGAKWIATKPEVERIDSYHVWEAYSPWVSWEEMASNYLEAVKGGPELMKVWVNTAKGESYEEEFDVVESSYLYKRREEYDTGTLPDEVLYITCGIDVQADRIELEVLGWGEKEETWSIDYRTIYGDPKTLELWTELEDFLFDSVFETVGGHQMRISATAIDMGYSTDDVLKFCKGKLGRKVYPVKGASTAGKPIIGNASKAKNLHVKFWMVGTDTAKDQIFSRLMIEKKGPRFCHFPTSYSEQYFTGLTCEKKKTAYKKGFAYSVWEKQDGDRNEPIDVRVYNTAAFNLSRPHLHTLARRRFKSKPTLKQVEKPNQKEPEEEVEEEEVNEVANDVIVLDDSPVKLSKDTKGPRRGGWVTNY